MAIDLDTEVIIGATRADDDPAIVRILSDGLVAWEDQFTTRVRSKGCGVVP
jgi:hypothetical protein